MSAAPSSIPPRSPTILEESWLAERLGAVDLFGGVTTAAERCGRVRARIEALEVAEALAGKRADGTCETFRSLFERLYGEPL